MKLSKFFILSLIISMLSNFSTTVHAKEYAIPELQIEIQIYDDGSIRITEHRTYFFDGSYSWANYRIPKSGISAIENIQVSEADENFTNLNSEEPQTFLVEESSGAFNVQWFFDANDEERTFSISYTIRGALTVGTEWSQFFWNYVAAGREKSTEEVTILLQLPDTTDRSNLYAWVREPDWDLDIAKLDNGFQFTGTDIDRNEAVIIRTVFPTSVLEDQIQVNEPGFSVDFAENEESEYRESQRQLAAEQARNYDLAVNAVIVLAGLSIVCFVFFYRKYGARHKMNYSQNKSIMIPGRQKPAAIGWLLMNQTVIGAHVTATLLDLSRRGYFRIEENEPDKESSSWLSTEEKGTYSVETVDKDIQSDSTISEWEEDLYSFITKRIKEEGNKMEDIFKFSETEVSKWFYAWKKKLSTYCKDQEWIDKKSYTGVFWNLGIQSALLLTGIALIFLLHPIMAVAMGIAFIGAVLSLAIIRRTPKGEEIYITWKGYRKALKNAKDYSIPDDKLGLHFIYGIALGLNKQEFEQMFEQNPDAVLLITWITILPGSTNSPASMASSFSNLAATGTISAGGGGVAGGGASVSSPGGGASGGAG
ncbi:DUF2207 family protein [Gracilimonas halophila]|uniref:DUF2207 family protein n=1 Tax=Gracilimonas halophila TaxID=1834464 RepID=A0ABW5JJU4_9BACT